MKARTVAVASLVLSEPGAAIAHRFVMHRIGWRWHRSHHVVRRSGWEDNDRFPLLFAALTIAGITVGRRTGRPALVAVGTGVTAYGTLYALVHDVCVHGRLTKGRAVLPGRWLRWVAESHAVHHCGGAAPYGFLVPIVPARYHDAVANLRDVVTRARLENTS